MKSSNKLLIKATMYIVSKTEIGFIALLEMRNVKKRAVLTFYTF